MRHVLSFFVLMLFSGCSGSTEPVECWFVEPSANAVLSGTTTVRLGYSGPAGSFTLLVNNEVAAQADSGDATESIVNLTWNTTLIPDGEVQFIARVDGVGTSYDTEPLTVLVDNTPPEASLDLERLSILQGVVSIPVTIEEVNVASVRLMSDDTELVTSSENLAELSWDTNQVVSKLYWVRLVVEDVAGRTVETEDIPVVVANNGRHLSLASGEYTYDPGAWVSATEDTRVSALMDIPDTDPRNIIRVISWLHWDASSNWTVEYSLGQGQCPHRGIMYVAGTSNTGELILDMAWSEVAEDLRRSAASYAPDYPAGSEDFPFNGDPLTVGSFFGHVRPVETEGNNVDIDVNFVFIYGEN